MKRPFLVLCLALSAAVAAAQEPPVPLKIEEFMRLPAFENPVLSRNGRYFAVTMPLNGRMNLAVVDLETRQGTTLTNFSDFDVIGVSWVGNDRLVFSLGQAFSPTGPGQFDGGGLFMVGRDGKESRKLSPTVRDLRNEGRNVARGYRLYRTLPDSDEEVIVAGNMRDENSQDLYRMNVRTGRATLLTTDRPPRTGDWILDRDFVPRIVESWVKDTNTQIVYYRKNAEAQWDEIARIDSTKGPMFVPLAFEADNRTLQVAHNGGRDTMAVFRFDPDTKTMGELVAQHPRYDMGADASGSRVPGVIRDWKTRDIVGYEVASDPPQIVYFDEAYARTQKTIDDALPGTVNRFYRAPDGKRLVVSSYSDRQPVKWYLVDEEKKTLEELFASRPWLPPERLVEMRPFLLKTREGLEIPSYYFLPKNRKPGERLPTILHIHGGPHVRADHWGQFGFGVLEAQLFASRGYAVVLPNFRVTPGFGSKIYYRGFGTYGREMVQDHEDAAKWAVEQGFADPERICLSGASYGGAGTLMALAAAPQLFKCGVVGLVLADTKLFLTSTAGDVPYSTAGVQFWLRLLGANDISSIPPETSPVNLAGKIKQPVLIYAGAQDIRTPIEQTRAMIRALENAGNPPKKTIIKAGEGHGFGKVENRVELYDAVMEFLDETIGPRSRK